MILHTVFVTHNRLHLTQQTIESYLATVTVPYSYIVIDNASRDGTQDWLAEQGHPYVALTDNHYPGFATNRGWELAPPDAVYLQRADNDMRFLPHWWAEVERWFRKERVGQVGLRTNSEENRVTLNVGGSCVIRRKLWDLGLRYDERPWPKYPAGMSEDSYFSPEVVKLGYRWERVKRSCLQSLATGDWSDPYYQKAYGDRRIVNPALKRIPANRHPRGPTERRRHG